METLQIKRTKSSDNDFVLLVSMLDSELFDRYQAAQARYDKYNKIELNDTVILVYIEGTPAGCGCFKQYDNETAEIKRMFVSTNFRGKGISKIILKELEKWASEKGFSKTILETGKKQHEAIGLYKNSGYHPMDNFGQYKDFPTSVCFKKDLLPD